MVVVRKGASSVKDVPAKILAQLEQGKIETATLAETLAVNFATLAKQAFPSLPSTGIDRLKAVNAKGVTVRMRAAGDMLNEFATRKQIEAASAHTSDIVRGWAAYTIPGNLPLDEQIIRVRPFANDSHFGVREWAWLSIRASICANPLDAIASLRHWAADSDPYIRRFACEATRPRGVWATHISSFKIDPSPALPILNQICLDSDEYVHRSVGNWLRDAAKTAPKWVASTIEAWERSHGKGSSLERLRRRSAV